MKRYIWRFHLSLVYQIIYLHTTLYRFLCSFVYLHCAQPTSAPVPTNPPTPDPTNAPTPPPTAFPTDSPTPFSCANITSKGSCNNDSRCTWSGNPNSGSCGSNGGGGEPPAPSPPSPTPPTGCPVCGNGDTCCAPNTCETSGPSWRRACV